MCIDFTDLNTTRSKYNLPLPKIDLLVDNAVGYELLSFMDACSSYNQILALKKTRRRQHLLQIEEYTILLQSDAIWVEECRCK